jgi:hypothetical protein
MRDAPQRYIRGPSAGLLDPTKGVDRLRQPEGGHGSRNPLRSVSQLTGRIYQPRKWMVLKPAPYRIAGDNVILYFLSRRAWRRAQKAYGASIAGASSSADLGCSSEYSIKY